MFNTFFRGIFDTQFTSVISVTDFLLCIGAALLCGLIMAGVYVLCNRCTKSFLMTLSLLPAIVCVMIMMVNGNVGTGVAVAGAFSLVRFRSAPGSAREISAIFLTMCAGLITGMGYLGFALLFTLILGGVMMLYEHLDFGASKKGKKYRTLHITVPEDLDYEGVFDEVLGKYCSSHELVQVKTTNLGSLFRLTYHLTMSGEENEKELIDELRCRNGNLEVSLSVQETAVCEL